MQDAPHVLWDYLLDELGPVERAEVEAWLQTSAAGRAELERLRLTHAALLRLPQEEIPQRIAFVSDPILEPSPWQRFWRGMLSGVPRPAMSMAAVLLVFFAGAWVTKPTLARTGNDWSLAFGAPAAPGDWEEKLRAAVREATVAAEARQREAAAASSASSAEIDREWMSAQIAAVRRELAEVHEDAAVGYELINAKHETFKRQILQIDMAALGGFGQ